MFLRKVIYLGLFFFIIACSKQEEPLYKPTAKVDPFKVYEEGLNAFEKNDFFYARKKFDEAESNFSNPQFAAKAALMSSFSLYAINFYDEAVENLKSYISKYPSEKNIIYAHYLESIIYFEQISDEKKDLGPLIKAKEKIDFFLEKYPNTEYAFDLKFKKDLIRNQLAAKELYVAKYYIKTEKWAAAIKRLQNILDTYDETIFIVEALYRLIEIYYYLGVEDEAKKYLSVLGYNYNSSEWFELSYKISNKDYKIAKKEIPNKNEKNFLNKIINIIK